MPNKDLEVKPECIMVPMMVSNATITEYLMENQSTTYEPRIEPCLLVPFRIAFWRNVALFR